MASALHHGADEKQAEEELRSRANSISGWALPILARLDRAGARGLVSDLVEAGALTRQAAFVLASAYEHLDVAKFLSALNITKEGAEGVGVALGHRRAREIIGAIYGVAPEAVPTGYLRALVRIEEVMASGAGLDPFAEPESYQILFKVFAEKGRGPKAHALRYCGKLRSSTIQAVEMLDPVLVWPEMLAMIGTNKQVRAVNALLAHVRSAAPSQNDEALITAMRQALGKKNILEDFARRMVERFDTLPEPPVPAQEGLRPLSSAAEYREFGRRMRNCAGDQVAQAALGMISIYEATCKGEDGRDVTVAASLTPMIDGQWEVTDIKLAKNKTPPDAVRRSVLQRFVAAGVLVSGPALSGPYQRDLGELLGAYRWGPLDECLRDLEQTESDAIDELEAALEAHT